MSPWSVLIEHGPGAPASAKIFRVASGYVTNGEEQLG